MPLPLPLSFDSFVSSFPIPPPLPSPSLSLSPLSIVHVDPLIGVDQIGCGSSPASSLSCQTIQYAIDACPDPIHNATTATAAVLLLASDPNSYVTTYSCSVMLGDGIYRASVSANNREIHFGLRSIQLQSRSGNPSSCILDGENQFSLFQVNITMAPNYPTLQARSMISGITLTRATDPTDPTYIINSRGGGGAVHVYGDPTATLAPQQQLLISNCIFTQNQASYASVALIEWSSYMSDRYNPTAAELSLNASVVIFDLCLIRNNSAFDLFGGLMVENSVVSVTRSNFSFNQNGGYLGSQTGQTWISHTVFRGNAGTKVNTDLGFLIWGPLLVTNAQSTRIDQEIQSDVNNVHSLDLLNVSVVDHVVDYATSAFDFASNGGLRVRQSLFANNYNPGLGLNLDNSNGRGTQWVAPAFAVSGQGPTPQFIDTIFRNNFSPIENGVFYTKHIIGLYFIRCVFDSNRAPIGSVTFVSQPNTRTYFSDSDFINNQATQSGAIDAQITNGGEAAWVYLDQCQFVNNSSPSGALASRTGTFTFTVTNSQFTNCTASQSGGAISLIAGTLVLTNSVLSHNQAGTSGGAIYISQGATAILNQNQFEFNFAEQDGGAIFVEGGSTLTISNQVFLANSATGNGGGILDTPLSTYVNVSFISNRASLGAAFYLPEKIAFSTSGTQYLTLPSATCANAFNAMNFESNEAINAGGAIYLAGTVPACTDVCGPIAVNVTVRPWNSNSNSDSNVLSLSPSAFAATSTALVQPIGLSDSSSYVTQKCSFVNNVADSHYGNNVGYQMTSVELVDLNIQPTAATDPAAANIQEDVFVNRDRSAPVIGSFQVPSGSELSSSFIPLAQYLANTNWKGAAIATNHLPESIAVYAGLPFSLAFGVFDYVNRSMTFDGSAFGVTVTVTVQQTSTSAQTNPSYAYSVDGELSVAANSGLASFSALTISAVPTPISAANDLQLVVTTSPASQVLVLPIRILDAPAGYVVALTPFYHAIPRAQFLDAETLSDSFNVGLVLLGTLILLIGSYTSQTVLDQVPANKDKVQRIDANTITSEGNLRLGTNGTKNRSFMAQWWNKYYSPRLAWLHVSSGCNSVIGIWCGICMYATASSINSAGQTLSFSLHSLYIVGAVILMLVTSAWIYQSTLTDGHQTAQVQRIQRTRGKQNDKSSAKAKGANSSSKPALIQPMPNRFGKNSSSDSEVDSSSCSSLDLADLHMEEVFEDETSAELLKECARASHNSENILFLSSVRAYRNLNSSFHRCVGALSIYRMYFIPNAQYEINISSRMRVDIENKMKTLIQLANATQTPNGNGNENANASPSLTGMMSKPSVIRAAVPSQKLSSHDHTVALSAISDLDLEHLFDSAYSEVFLLLRTNVWELFSSSPSYRVCQLIAAQKKQHHHIINQHHIQQQEQL